MRKMKKLIALALIIAVITATTACSSTPDATEFLTSVYENTQDDTKVEIASTMGFEMSSAGETFEFNLNMNMAMDMSDIEDPQIAVETSTAALSEQIDINIYYTDGYAYIDILGMKVKQEAPIDNIDEYYDSSMDMYDISSLTDVILTEEGGNYRVTYILNEEEAMDLFFDNMSSMGEQFDLSSLGGTVEFTELVTSTLADKEGNFISQELLMTGEITIEGEVIEFSMDSVFEYLASGDDVVIEFPDFEGYVEGDFAS